MPAGVRGVHDRYATRATQDGSPILRYTDVVRIQAGRIVVRLDLAANDLPFDASDVDQIISRAIERVGAASAA